MVCICHIGTFQITDDPPPTPPQKETSKLQIVVQKVPIKNLVLIIPEKQ